MSARPKIGFASGAARTSQESIACFRRMVALTPGIDMDVISEARTGADAVHISYDWTRAKYGRGKVTEAHYAAEGMRLPKISALLDGDVVPSGMACSARLP